MKRVLLISAAWIVVLVVLYSPSAKGFGLKEVGITFTDSEGSPALEAGSHPFAMTTTLNVETVVDPEAGEIPVGAVQNLKIDLPPGFAGNPTATPRCTNSEFAAIDPASKRPACSDDTALGVANVRVGFTAPENVKTAVFNLPPAPGKAAKLGFVALGVPVTIDVGLSPEAPYHVLATSTDISQALLFYGSEVTLWGNPASPLHNAERGKCAEGVAPSCPTSAAEKPFITLPTSCSGALPTDFWIEAWNTGETDAQTALTEPGIFACAGLGFAPTIAAQPTQAAAESPSGLDFDVNVKDPGLTSPSGRAQSAVKKAVVTLPEGMTVNPSQAAGLQACSEAQLAGETPSSPPGAGCPNASKVGTVAVKTPLLEGEILEGSLFVATPYQNPTGSLIAIYMVIKSPELGIVLKLPGKVEPDPASGRLVSTFDDLPQLPFSSFHLHFREGGRSPLITPPACGTYEVSAQFTPWANPATPYTTSSSFKVSTGVGGGPCPAAAIPPFAPGFLAGSASNTAGTYSPFYMRLTRQDGEQEMTRFSAILPPGVTGKIAGLAQCSQAAIASARQKSGLAEAASPSCPAGSAIGRTLAGAGVGPELTYVPGYLYLAGPYNGAPLSVVAITPALAGPFDVGTVVVQVALNLNPVTAEVEVDGAASDPFPHILKGIPLKLRDLRVYADRPNFTLNATDCEASSARATLFGSYADVFSPIDDQPVSLASRYQAADCASLFYKPRLKLSLKGGTKRGGHPALRSVLTTRAGDANTGRAVVVLPNSQQIDNAHINNPCTRDQFNEDNCPAGSILGTARVHTPLLDQPLEGKVYFRANGGARLIPDIVIELRGQFRVILTGFVDTLTPKTNPRIRTTFASTPDAPFSKLELNLYGGKRGLLVNNRNLCKSKQRAKLVFRAQNNRVSRSKPAVATSCKAKKKAKGRKR